MVRTQQTLKEVKLQLWVLVTCIASNFHTKKVQATISPSHMGVTIETLMTKVTLFSPPAHQQVALCHAAAIILYTTTVVKIINELSFYFKSRKENKRSMFNKALEGRTG